MQSSEATLNLATAALLQALRERDAYTWDHCDRAGHRAVAVARALSLSETECRCVYWAAELHDVGKLAIPDAILLKPGPLDADEMALMRTHSQKSCDILRAIPDPVIEPIAQAVLHHHEAWDGSGYPAGLRGTDIPLAARIVAVVDVYDALTTHRTYHSARPHDEVVAWIAQGAGSRFDPAVVKAFLGVGSFGPDLYN
jgi:HD-GYP domain-containing protein (c-di-GMP phosphodiesterase class II)